MEPEQPPRGGVPGWLKGILITLGILIGLVVLLVGGCFLLFALGPPI